MDTSRMARRAWRRVRLFLALLLVCAGACVSTDRAPAVAARHVLAPGLISGNQRAKPPFAVVFAGPRGEASEVSALSVVFNRPLRALQPVGSGGATRAPSAEAAGLPLVQLSPTPRGRWQWVG